jgi:hypothetical protein
VTPEAMATKREVKNIITTVISGEPFFTGGIKK